MTRLPPSASPGPEAALMPDPGPGEVSATAATPPPASLEFVELPFGQAPIPVTEASGQHFQDPAPTEPPKLYPPLPLKLQALPLGSITPERRRHTTLTRKTLSGPPRRTPPTHGEPRSF
ncbi:lysine-rich arabinogalactan protein 19-like [Cervus elaphus]|uniref:lysine-rich arabinogalactan protein 19-like n=1 Tax=Cervus elaphus TaxID=9860 RepID=UPI001CC2D4D9|nr:lysine-rich arabinogalactan protein 19-like [Cervus elaphus]